MSITEFQDYDLHTKDWGFLPNAIMQVSGPRCCGSAAVGARAGDAVPGGTAAAGIADLVGGSARRASQ